MAEITPMRGSRNPRTPCDCCCADEFRRAHEKRTATDEIDEQLAEGEPMTETVVCPPNDESWMRCYTMAIERYEAVCMKVFRTIADHEPLADLVDFVADSMNGVDAVDEESIDLYERARAAAVRDDRR